MGRERDAGGGGRGAPPYIYHVRAREKGKYSSGSPEKESPPGGETP